jgi:hypothetical protein
MCKTTTEDKKMANTPEEQRAQRLAEVAAMIADLATRPRVSIPTAQEMSKRGVSLLWRPDPTLKEADQYAIVLFDPEEN